MIGVPSEIRKRPSLNDLNVIRDVVLTRLVFHEDSIHQLLYNVQSLLSKHDPTNTVLLQRID